MTRHRAIRILIVEDDIVDRKLLERLLSKSSLEVSDVQCADTLAGAIASLKTSDFDIILLDLGLPDGQSMDSVTTLQARAPQIPIIVLTGLDDDNVATAALQKGAQDYLVKGQVDSGLLMRSMRYALERKRAEHALQVAEQRYRTIFENSAVAIMMVDDAERLVSWNKFTERLLGSSEADLHGRDVRSLYPETEWRRIRMSNLRQKGMEFHLETRMIRKDGTIIDVDLSVSVLQDSEGRTTGTIGVVRDITERKEMEEALRRSESRFRQVVENAKEWIWEIDAEGVYTYASPVVKTIMGYDPEELLGRMHFYDAFHPDDSEELKARTFEIFERRDVFSEVQTRNLHKDGRVVWLQRSGVPILGENQELLGYRGVDVDITDRVQLYEVLDRKQKNLEAIFDAAPFGMLLVNEQQIVIRANDAVRQMSGKGYHEIINRHPCEALACARASGDTRENASCEACWLRKLIETMFETEVPIHGVELRPVLNDSGEELQPWLSVSVEPVHVDEARHVLVALNDVTDRKRAEEQLREAMELKSQFVSTVSHELRTPLTSMREAVIIVADGAAGKLNKDQSHFLGIARRNIDRLGRLIDNVLDFQKLNAGKMVFHIEPHDVRQTIEDAYNTMRPHAAKKHVRLKMDAPEDLGSASYDSDRLIQVLTNLVSNAIKFTPEGGSIDVSARRQGESLAFRVRDTGLGIPKDDLPKVFNRFFRVHRPGKEIKGTGLGLAIVHKIIAAHGGRIDVQSEVDQGTTFTVQLPLDAARSDKAGLRQADEQLEAALLSAQDRRAT